MKTYLEELPGLREFMNSTPLELFQEEILDTTSNQEGELNHQYKHGRYTKANRRVSCMLYARKYRIENKESYLASAKKTRDKSPSRTPEARHKEYLRTKLKRASL